MHYRNELVVLGLWITISTAGLLLVVFVLAIAVGVRAPRCL